MVYRLTKRLIDILAAGVGLVVLAVPLAVIYLAIRLTSPGGGFFVQPRAGRDGKPFPLIKFRTMRADHAHNPDPSIVITGGHPGVTRVGRVLRHWKLDELPQLLNVLVGQMSLVGPRPTVLEQVREYDDYKRRRLSVPPGITGLAQIHGGTALTWDERIDWDVYYVEHRSLRMDLSILLRTFTNLLGGSDGKAVRVEEWKKAEQKASGSRHQASEQ